MYIKNLTANKFFRGNMRSHQEAYCLRRTSRGVLGALQPSSHSLLLHALLFRGLGTSPEDARGHSDQGKWLNPRTIFRLVAIVPIILYESVILEIIV